nr:MATE family efflux transporter [Gemmatimonadales bacterium]
IGVANLLNIALNRLLIFGGLGIPAMGVAGSAWATTISRIITLPLLLYFARRELIPLFRPWLPAAARLAPLRSMLRIGLPIGVQLELEMSAFAAVALLMGRFGTIQVAGHQIALNLASLTFMVPMGIGMGAAVLAGNAVGRADAPGLRAASRAALGTGVAFMSCTALIFLAVPALLAGIYTNDVAVLGFAATLLPIAGVFQVFDGVQVVAAGILRGLGDTRAPMLINLAGFTCVGLSMSLYLGFRTSLGAIGLWWGLVIGLATVAGILLIRVRHALRRPVTSWDVHETG